MTICTRRLVRAGVLALTALSAGASQASEFVTETGMVDLTGATVAFSFDATDDDVHVVDHSPLAGSLPIVSDGQIEGSGAAVVGGEVYGIVLSLERHRPQLAGRRVKVTMWQQPNGTSATLLLRWRTQISGKSVVLAEIPAQRTGRRTDDGWYEVSTGPVDYLLAGSAPAHVVIADDQPSSGRSGYVRDPGRTVRVDALSVEDVGVAAVPPRHCDSGSEEEACGPGVCWYGTCADAAAVLGPLPRAEVRRDYLDRRAREAWLWTGSREAQSRLVAFEEALSRLPTAESPRAWWRGLWRAYADLRDGHARAPMAAVRSMAPSGACMVAGDADLLGLGELPLVIATDPALPTGELLRPGDVVTHVDDVAVWEWLEDKARFPRGDPLSTRSYAASALLDAAMESGSRIRVGRCTESEGHTCAVPPTFFEVDLAEEMGRAVVSGGAADWPEAALACDGRLARPDASFEEAAAGGLTIATHEEAGIRRVVFGHLPHLAESQPESIDEWLSEMDRALVESPPGLVMDVRLGRGGYVSSAAHVASHLLPAATGARAEEYAPLTTPVTPELRETLVDCSPALWGSCGAVLAVPVRQWGDGVPGQAADRSLAVLTSRTASAHEMLVRLLRARDAPTRIFGPPATPGMFGPVRRMPVLAGEREGPWLQTADTLFIDGDPAALPPFESGHGIAADEEVLQRQSDVLLGIDTAVEAARRWLEAAP